MPALNTILTLPLNLCNRELTPETAQRVISLRDELESRAPYNTLDAALDLCDRATSAPGPAPFAAVQAQGPRPFDAAFVQAKGSNCFGMAQLLCGRLKEDLGLEAYVVARPCREGVVSLWPALTHPGKTVHAALSASLDEVIHVDVAVPVRRQDTGKLSVLTLFCGGGPATAVERHETPQDTDWLSKLRLVPNPQLLQHRAVTGAHKLYLSDSNNGCTFGIDLFRGLVFLSRNALDASLRHGEENKESSGQLIGRNFDFGRLLSREAMAVSDDDEDEIASIAREWRLCRVFLMHVGVLFAREPSFVARTEKLLRHWRAYGSEVLIASFSTLRACIIERDEAMEASSASLELLNVWKLQRPSLYEEAQQDLKRAAWAVYQEEAYLAKALYQRAKSTYHRSTGQVAELAEHALGKAPHTFRSLRAELVTQLPTEVFVRIEQSLRKVDPSGTQFLRLMGDEGAKRSQRLRHLIMTL